MDNNEIRKQMELEQKRAFCKQSCTKIDQGLDKLDPRSGERAIWELFQNARDLAQIDHNGEKKAHIKITLTPSEFIFAHQGKPFDHDSLTSLVMQVSSQDKENEDSVGQYGTGFLTTHVFGRRLYVTGSLDMSKYIPGTYTNINRFVIDRTYNNITEFVDKVAHQLLAVSDFADATKISNCRQWTELNYDLSSMEGAADNASAAIASSVEIIPYVMTINKPIVDVALENQLTGDVYRFEKIQLPDEDGLKVMQVSITHNGKRETRKIYFLESEDGEGLVILPLESPAKAQPLSGIAKLFVFFPLIGTEDFGMDVVFHSKKFIPVEERNGLHLPVSNANVRSKYEQNIRVLNSLTEMVHNYYKIHANTISNWVSVAGLTFDCEHHKEEVTKEFFRNFKERWSTFYQTLPIIDINGNRVSVNGSNIRFFSQSIVSDLESEEIGDDANFTALYDAAAHRNQMADRHEIIYWSKVIASWDSAHPSMIDVDEIARNIGESEAVSVEVVRAFDAYLAQKGLISLFDTYTLIPNREGNKMKRSDLRNASTIPGWLGEITKTLIADKIQSFADDTFIGLASMTLFTRNDLRDAITSSLRSLRQEWLEKGKMYGAPVMEALLKLSSVFSSETSSVIRRQTIETIGTHLQIKLDSRILTPLDSNERDIAELPFKHLVECMLLEISQKDPNWMTANMDYVVSLHFVLSNWTEYYNRNTKDGLCVKYGAFPNRNGQPCIVRDLEKGIGIPDVLVRLYQEVMGEDLSKRLVDDRFESFYDFIELSAKDVACEIEAKLEENGFHHTAVLDIINNLAQNECWGQWFPRIAAQKAELFLNQVHEECKEGIFKLMKINDPDKLNQLAELADDVNLDEILEKGRAALIAKRNQEAEFNFKLSLGKYVEGLIKEHLSCQLSTDEITVETEQYGSDLSIWKNGNPIYYIEVKSRWGTEQSVMMSPLQMKVSVKEADNYALCCVDMSHMHINEEEEHIYPVLEEVLPHIKVLPNIGKLNEEVANIATGTDAREVYIGGDYKCVIPQVTIKKEGRNLENLIPIILNKLKFCNFVG